MEHVYSEDMTPSAVPNINVPLPVAANAGQQLTVNQSGTGLEYNNHSINALSDVDTTTTAPTDGQALVWNDSYNEWKPGTVASSGGGTTVVANPSGTSTNELTKITISGTDYNISGANAIYHEEEPFQ